jgi:hypothetical protein
MRVFLIIILVAVVAYWLGGVGTFVWAMAGLIALYLFALFAFGSVYRYPNLRQPRNYAEASILLRRVLSISEQREDRHWSDFELPMIWGVFLHADESDVAELSEARQEVWHLLEKHGVVPTDFDYDTGPVYSDPDLKMELSALAESWRERAGQTEINSDETNSYLNDKRVSKGPFAYQAWSKLRAR